MSGERQTVAGAYMKIAAHEELCAERYRGINEKLSWVLRSLVGMLLALLAWALVQLYALEPMRARQFEQPTRQALERPPVQKLDSRSIAVRIVADRGSSKSGPIETAMRGFIINAS